MSRFLPRLSWRSLLGWVAAGLLLTLLAVVPRCYNWRETFIGGEVYFVDGDCYARMTRVQRVLAHPGTVIHRHEFENYPEGVRSHTTAPFDYMLALGKVALDAGFAVTGQGNSPWAARTLDLAGAWVPLLFGVLTCWYLAWWGRWGCGEEAESPVRRVWWAAPVFFAVSPVLMQGTVLGRPDHQAPIIFLLVVALTAELSLATGGDRWRKGWCVVAGLSWGMALWISLFEPLLLFLGVTVAVAIFARGTWWRRARVWQYGVFLGIVGLMLVEGSPIPHLPPEVAKYFPRWGKTIGELRHLDPRQPLLYRWLGAGCVLAPLALAWAGRRDRRAWGMLALWLAMLGATCAYMRWGYFLGIAYALTLPWQLGLLGRRQWVMALVLGASLYPLAWEWDELFFPEGDAAQALETRQRERVLLREVAVRMKSPYGEVAPFLAPWWLSPALAYWSGQPGVSGSSHEGLPGIVDTARFYLAGTPEEAAEVLRRRRIAWVVVDEPDRLIPTSAPLLDHAPPAEPLCRVLYRTPHRGPRFLKLQQQTSYYKLFSVTLPDSPL